MGEGSKGGQGTIGSLRQLEPLLAMLDVVFVMCSLTTRLCMANTLTDINAPSSELRRLHQRSCQRSLAVHKPPP